MLGDSLGGGGAPSRARPWLIAAALIAAGIAALWLLLGKDEQGQGEGAPSGPVHGTDFERSVAYHSPQTPGYTAWTGVWTMPGGELMTAFAQVTGPIPSPPDRDWASHDVSAVYLRSSDGGRNWEEFRSDPVEGPPQAYSGQATIGLEDGTLLRRVNGEDLRGFTRGPRTAYLQRLEPGAKDWSEPTYLLDPERYTYNVSRIQELRDGRLVATGNFWEIPAGERDPTAEIPLDQQGWLLMVSDDEGRTWRDALTVPPENQVQPNEWDVAELENGDLLAMMRTRDPANPAAQVRRQALLEKDGDGWTMGAPQPTPFPHSGHPELLATEEGVVLHVATSGIHYTPDAGETWDRLVFPGASEPYRSAYYPVSVQDPDGDIFVLSHSGGDDDYGEHDQAIVMDRFRLASGER
jgi:hypothetical protein